MRLHVANCTHQLQHLTYRMFETKRPHMQTCDAGQQIMLGGADINPLQLEDLIKQQRTYGLILVDELGNVPADLFVPFIASADKPITIDTIRRVVAHNQAVLAARGKRFRQEAAIAANRQISEMTPEAADTMRLSVQEETPGTGADGGDPVNEGFRITSRAAA